MRRIFYLFFIGVIFLESCHSDEKTISSYVQSAADAKRDSILNSSPALGKYKIFSLTDSIISKGKFLSCLFPTDWDISYYTKCVADDNENPLKYGIVAEDSNGVKRFELFPVYSFVTMSNAALLKSDSLGGNKLKTMKAQIICATAIDAIKDFILPYCRKDLVNDYHITEVKTLKSLSPGAGAGDNTNQSETGLVRLEYNRDGKAFEEIIFATLQKKYVSLNGYDSKCFWHISYACSFRTLKGQLVDELGTFQTIIGSIKYDPEWYYKYFWAVQSIQNSNENYNSEKIVSLFNSSPEIRNDKDLVAIENLKRQMARAFDIYTIYNIRVDAYLNFNGDVIRLPKGYNIAWKNKDNDFLLAENDSYIPKNKAEWIQLKRNVSLIEENYLIGCNQ